MLRPRIDRAVHAQLDRLVRLLRDVDRKGGKMDWSQMFAEGHKYPTVRSAMRQSYLLAKSAYRYELTDAGRWYLSSLDEMSMAIR